MKRYIVEYTMAYKIPAENEEDALVQFSKNPGSQEHWHEEAGYWSEVSCVYECDGDECEEEN
jgi:hypothetical protein